MKHTFENIFPKPYASFLYRFVLLFFCKVYHQIFFDLPWLYSVGNVSYVLEKKKKKRQLEVESSIPHPKTYTPSGIHFSVPWPPGQTL